MVTGGGTAGTGGAVAVAGTGTGAVVVPGTVVTGTTPAMMTMAPMMATMMPGIALGILKALFLGNLDSTKI